MGVLNAASVAAGALLVLLVCCASASASVACPGDAMAPTTASSSDAAADLLCDMNVLRAGEGLPPLEIDRRLAQAAQGMADDLAAHRLFSHIASDGETLTDRVTASGYVGRDGWLLAENIGWGSRNLSSPFEVSQSWMGSPDHRRNLLDPDLTDVGIGLAAGAPAGVAQGGMYYVADFGSPGQLVPAATPTTRGRNCHRRKRSRHHNRVRTRRLHRARTDC